MSLIYSILQSWKEQVEDQVIEIKKNLYSLKSKCLYYYTLELELKNRKSLRLMLELNQLNEEYNHQIPDPMVQDYIQRFLEINFDDIHYVSIGSNVNQQKTLRSLANQDQNLKERLDEYDRQMRLTFKNLEMEIESLSHQIGQCEDKKTKKLLVNQRYRREENIYYFKLLVGTLNTLSLIYQILVQYQNRMPIPDEFQNQIDQQTHDQMNQGMYIRTTTTGRRNKIYLKVIISCLALVAIYTNTTHYTTNDAYSINQNTQAQHFQQYNQAEFASQQSIENNNSIFKMNFHGAQNNGNIFGGSKSGEGLSWKESIKGYFNNMFGSTYGFESASRESYEGREKGTKRAGKTNAEEIQQDEYTWDASTVQYSSPVPTTASLELEKIVIRTTEIIPEEFLFEYYGLPYHVEYQTIASNYFERYQEIDQSLIEENCKAINLVIDISSLNSDTQFSIIDTLVLLKSNCEVPQI